MKRLKLLTLTLITGILFGIPLVMNAQVTIGAGTKPAKAALLDLKSHEASSDNVTSDKGGLILPRVKLVTATTLEPFIATNDPDWTNNATSKIKEKHIGLVVYNLTSDAIFSPGFYIWNGTTWGTYGTSSAGGVTVDNGLTKIGDNIALGGSLTKVTTIAQGANAFNINGTGAFTVASPTNLSGATAIGGALRITSGSPAAGKVLTSDATGNVTWGPLTDTKYAAGCGLTLNTTTNTMDLGGTLYSARSVNQGTYPFGFTGTGAFSIANPTTLGGALTISSGTPGAGKVLTSDAAGNATWQTKGDNNTTYTANNGVTLSGTTMQLGGTLLQATTIAQAAFPLSFTGTGALSIANPTTISGATAITGALRVASGTPGAGKVLTSDAAGNATWQNKGDNNTTYTANNGVTLSGTTMQLGGTLLQATTIAQAAFPLSFTGTGALSIANPTTISGATAITGALRVASGTPGAGKVLTSDAAGNATWQTKADNNTTYTANNGVTLSGTTMQLGGTLLQATTIAQATFPLSFTGTGALSVANPTTLSGALRVASGAPGAGKVLTSDATGNATWQANPNTTYTANNGVTLTGTSMQLGGTLLQATTIAQATFPLSFTGTGALSIANPTTLSGALRVASGAPGAGKVLTSDATGNATWQANPNTTYTANNGVTLSGTTMQLGGTLAKATTIAQAAQGLSITSAVGTASTATFGTANAALRLDGTKKGFMPPRVTLNSATDNTTVPVAAADKGMLVYHIGGGTNPNMTEGIYAWNGTSWKVLISEIPPTPTNQVKMYYQTLSTTGGLANGDDFSKMKSLIFSPTGAVHAPTTIKLPETGSFAFNVKLYSWLLDAVTGELRPPSKSGKIVVYVGVWIDGVLQDISEIFPQIDYWVGMQHLDVVSVDNVILGASGKAGQTVDIRFGYLQNSTGTGFAVGSRGRVVSTPTSMRTTMLFWKL